jgi:uncharacterized protein
MRSYFRYLVILFVFIGYSPAFAGSYEDFFIAIKQDDASGIAGLLRRGFDPNTTDPAGLTGLFLAIRDDSLKSARVLVDWPKTKVETRNKQDESPLMMAALKGHLDLCKRLIERDADVNKTGWTPLHYASTSGHVAVMQLLLDNSAYIDAESPNGTTPLMMAAHYGSAEAVRLLLDAGADPGLKNQLGLTAIDFAFRANRQEVADLVAAAIRKGRPKGKW